MTGDLRKGLHGLAAFVFLLVAACGGGGGGGAPAAPPPPSPPPAGDDTTFGTLALSDSNADAIGLAISLSEGGLVVYQAAINAVLDFASPSGAPSRDCGNTGTVSVDLQDNDTSFGISAGDVVTVTYTDCYDPIVDDTVNGSVAIVISEFSLDNQTAGLAGELSVQTGLTITDATDPALTAQVSSFASFDFALDVPEVLTVQATGGQEFAVEIDGVTERMRNFTLTKTATRLAPGPAAANVDTTVEIDVFYNSEALGGSFTCTSIDLAFDGNISGNALRAEIICTGLNGSAVRITNQNQVEVDPSGTGDFTNLGVFQWDQVIEGFLASDSGLVLDELGGDVETSRVTMRTNDLKWDWGRDRLLVTTRADDPSYPNSLLEISLTENRIIPVATYLDEPNLIELSEDGSTIYVTFTGSAEIRPYGAATYQSLPPITVTSDEPFSSDYAVLDIAASPADASRIAVAFQFAGTGSTDVVVFDGDVQGSSTYRDATGGAAPDIDAVEFSQDGARVFGGRSSTTFGAVLDLDADGVSAAAPAPYGFGGDFQRVQERLYVGATVLDDTFLARVGSHAFTPWATGVDLASRKVLMVQDSLLGVFDFDFFVPLATYDLGLAPTAVIEKVVPAGNRVVLADENSLYLVDAADLVTTNSGDCLPATLATGEGENYRSIDCPITDAMYDPARGSIYAAINSSLGVNGNSIAVIDALLGQVNLYVYVGSEPSDIAMSGDGNYLYVLFDGADAMATIDLNSMQVIRELTIGPELLAFGAEPRRGLALAASPVENDAVIVTLGGPTSSPFVAYTLVRDGVRLPDDVTRFDLQDNSTNIGPRVFFDAGGIAYGVSQDGDAAVVQTLDVGPTGLSAGSFFTVDPAQVGEGPVDVSQNQLFTPLGAVIDLGTQSGADRYESGLMSFDDGRGSLAVNADVTTNDVYSLVGTVRNRTGIGRFDYASGALLAEEEFEGFAGSSFTNKRLFDIGDDRLGILADTPFRLLVVDKASIQ